MSWDYRVCIEENKLGEFTADIREVYYCGGKIGITNPMTLFGNAYTKEQSIIELRDKLSKMLEVVNLVLNGTTSEFDYNDKSTHSPEKKNDFVYNNSVLDKDDDYMDEKYGESD